jgi:hypothetical protein
MSLVPHPRIHVHLDASSAAPLALATVVVAALVLAVIAALVAALPA